MPVKYTDEEKRVFKELWASCSTLDELVREWERKGMTRPMTKGQASNRAWAWKLGKLGGPPKGFDREDKPYFNRQIDVSLGEKSGTVTVRSLDVKDEQRAMEVAQVDTTRWKAVEKVIKFWEVTMSGERSSTNQDQTYTNCLVSVKLAPKTPQERGHEAMLEGLKAHPKIPTPRIRKSVRGDVLAVCGLTDHHFGMYAWAAETGEDYDLGIAEALYAGAIERTVRRAQQHGNVTRLVLPLGSDLFHLNDTKGVTPQSGNVLDVDTRFAKVVEVVERAVINGIGHALKIVPQVEYVWLPGNHDYEASFQLARTIAAWFRKTDRLRIDTSVRARKFVEHGVNAVMLAHGEKENPRDLPTIMASEEPELWGRTSCHECLRGHLHKREVRMWSHSGSFGLFTLRTLPSLAGREKYAYDKGYFSPRACETYLYHETLGYRGHIVVSAAEILEGATAA